MGLAFLVYLASILPGIGTAATILGFVGTFTAGAFYCALKGIEADDEDEDEIIKIWQRRLPSLLYRIFIPLFILGLLIPSQQQMLYIGGAYALDTGYQGIKNLDAVQQASPKLAELIQLQLDKMIADLKPKESEK